MEGFVRTARRNLGDDNDDKVLREMGLDDWVRAFCSFDAATPVLTLEGLEAISSLEVGDYVLAYDEATDTIGYYPISAIWMHEDPLVLYLVIDGELIETTPDHPFYTMDGEWVAAGELQPGDKIRQADGSYGTVEAVQFVYQLQPMYNLTVADAHTFFVGDGRWLVHNSCLDDFLSKVTDGRGRNVGHYKGTVADADEIFHKLIDPGTFTWDPQARLFYVWLHTWWT